MNDDQISDDRTGLDPPVGRTRRRFLLGGAVAGLAAVTAACADDEDASDAPTPQPGDASPDGTTDASSPDGATAGGDTDQENDIVVADGDVDGGRDPNNPTAAEPSAALAEDLDTAAFAAGLEVLAIDTYRRTAEAAASGALGPVPPAVAELLTTVMGHHQAALDQWNRALAVSGKPQVTKPDPTLQPTVDAALKMVVDVPSAARLALMLEDTAAATYLAAIPKLKAPESIAVAASIQPVDMQHAAMLRFALGDYPVPDTFARTEAAAMPA